MSSSSPWPSPEPATRRRWLAAAASVGAWAASGGLVSAMAHTPAPGVLEALGLRLATRGSGTMRFFGLTVYTARLWTTEGFDPNRHADHPLALELAYARPFSARQIAERSLQEMKRQTPINQAVEAHWTHQLTSVLPDVKAGDRLLGIHRPQQGAVFMAGAQPGARVLGTVDDPQFSALFFGIWLSPATSEPGLRAALLATG